jgi:hypothetical protein
MRFSRMTESALPVTATLEALPGVTENGLEPAMLEAELLAPVERPSGDRGLIAPFAGQVTVSVVVPTLNEAANLPHVLPRIPSWVFEVLLVDGGSVDGTVDVAQALMPSIRVLGQERPGKGAALRAGFAAARGDIIVTLDADGSTDPAELPAYVGCLMSGADFVKGSRFLQGGGTEDMGVVRKAGNWALRSAVRTAFGGRYSDLCYGYTAFWRRILPLLDGEGDGFEIETILNVRALAAGMRVVEVPSYECRRIHGLSNLNTWRDGYRVLRTIGRERRCLRNERRGAPRRMVSSLLTVVEPAAPLDAGAALACDGRPTASAEPGLPNIAIAAVAVPPDTMHLNGSGNGSAPTVTIRPN